MVSIYFSKFPIDQAIDSRISANPSRINSKKNTSWYVTVKLENKSEIQMKNLQKNHYIIERYEKMTAVFSSAYERQGTMWLYL